MQFKQKIGAQNFFKTLAVSNIRNTQIITTSSEEIARNFIALSFLIGMSFLSHEEADWRITTYQKLGNKLIEKYYYMLCR